MATAAQITQVRLNINDELSGDFTDAQIESYIDDKSSVAYASYKLVQILIVRLRKEIIKRDETGTEKTEFANLESRLKILKDIAEMYKSDYEDELGYSTGRAISTNKPTIAGGDI